jgi:hypothetical protein
MGSFRGCIAGCLGRVFFIILALFLLAFYIKLHGPVM